MITVSNASHRDPELRVSCAALRNKRLSRALVVHGHLVKPGFEMDACLVVGRGRDTTIDQIYLLGWYGFAGKLKMRMAGILRQDLAGGDLCDG